MLGCFHLIIVLITVGEPVPEYQIPFTDIVGDNPTLETMTNVVVTEKKRPRLFDIWNTNKASLNQVSNYWSICGSVLSTKCDPLINHQALLLHIPASFSLAIKKSSMIIHSVSPAEF